VIVFDASVIISFLDADDELHSRARSLITREVADDFGINVITLAEVLVGPTRQLRSQAVLDTLRGLEVAELDLPAEAASQLAQLRASTGTRMPDCCVLLSAMDHGARLASFDGRLNRVAVQLGLTVLRT
jgi:predicted nucleic acid-binding protein